MSRKATISILLSAILLFGCSSESGLQLGECAHGPGCGGDVYVVDTIQLKTVYDDGTALGFDLDGLDSDGDHADDCYNSDYISPDGQHGIDNQIGKLIEFAGEGIAETLEQTMQSMIGAGGLLFLLEMVHGPKPEDPGAMVLRLGAGEPLLGTHGKLLSWQTLTLDPEPVMAVSDHVSYTPTGASAGPFVFEFRFRFLAARVRLPFQATQITYTTKPDGSLAGAFGGYVLLDDALSVANLLGGDDTETREALKGFLPLVADVRGPDDECSGISAALGFHAVPAYISAVSAANVDTLSPEYLFEKATCVGCHEVASIPSARGFNGPPLDGLADRAGDTVPGMSAEDYIRQSIVDPAAHIVPGYGSSEMPANLKQYLTDEEYEILVGWLGAL